jgi:hypothetical protein
MTPEEIAEQLAAAYAVAEATIKRAPLGLRAVEPGRGRWYLVAFDGPAFLCLTADLRPESVERAVQDVAAAGLLYERLEQYVAAEALRGVAAAAGKVVARSEEDAATLDALVRLGQEALDLAAWSDAPERVVASVPQLDAASLLHEQLRRTYARFVAATDPLVAVQDTLPPERMAALRGVEEAAGEAGLGENLAQRLGAAMEDCSVAAAEIAAAHITPLQA